MEDLSLAPPRRERVLDRFRDNRTRRARIRGSISRKFLTSHGNLDVAKFTDTSYSPALTAAKIRTIRDATGKPEDHAGIEHSENLRCSRDVLRRHVRAAGPP